MQRLAAKVRLNAKARLERYRHAFAHEGSQGSYQQ